MPHEHSHDHPHEHADAPSGDALVLDIGGTIGALVIYTDPAADEAEIEISAGADPMAPRTHNQVHPRRAPKGTVYTAVFPAVEAGEYTVWRDSGTPAGQVSIHGGHVAEFHWT